MARNRISIRRPTGLFQCRPDYRLIERFALLAIVRVATCNANDPGARDRARDFGALHHRILETDQERRNRRAPALDQGVGGQCRRERYQRDLVPIKTGPHLAEDLA